MIVSLEPGFSPVMSASREKLFQQLLIPSRKAAKAAIAFPSRPNTRLKPGVNEMEIR
jgi:hypothetical protein